MCNVVNKYKEPYDVYIGRGSVWGNPFSHLESSLAKYRVADRDEAVRRYKPYLWELIRSGEITLEMLRELDGKTLGCYCKPKSCHGDVIKAAVEWAVRISKEDV